MPNINPNKTYLSEVTFSAKHLFTYVGVFALLCGIYIYSSMALNPNLPGDVNGDNIVDSLDLSLLLKNYDSTTYKDADFDNSGKVDVPDLSVLLTNYGKSYTPTPPPPTSGRSFTGWPESQRPAFTPTRTITVTSQSAFTTAWNNLQPGDKIDVRGVTFNGSVTLWNKNLTNWAEIHFDSATKFVGNSSTYYGVNIRNLSKIRFYGGEVTNPYDVGILIDDANDFTWWGFKAHDCAQGCLSVWNLSKPGDRIDIRGEVYNWGQVLSKDSHCNLECGTGMHGLYLGGGNYRTSGTFIIYAHDGPTGAGIEIGPHTQDSIIEVDARRLTFPAKIQVAGNAIQLWGNDMKNIKIRYAYGEDLTARVIETDALSSSNPQGSVVVEYGRAVRTNTAINPTLPDKTNPYAGTVNGVVIYQDVK